MEPVRVSSISKRIVKISAGYHHSAAITEGRRTLYMGKERKRTAWPWKENCFMKTTSILVITHSWYQSTEAEKIIFLPLKVECLEGVSIKAASLGFEHSIAITDNGEALSWGEGESGRLGHGHESSFLGFQRSSSEYTPRLIKGLERVKGLGLTKSATIPSKISTLSSSDQVACGGYHTCVITSNFSSDGGELYTWGSNENGCLGIGCTEVTYAPERIKGPFLRQPVKEVSCGWKHTAAISVLVNIEEAMFTRGDGVVHMEHLKKMDIHQGGNWGQGDDADYIVPTLLDFQKSVKALQVSCGFNHTAGIFQFM
ncbi:hypothetical protein OROHE_007141 [Orobanche hederae]